MTHGPIRYTALAVAMLCWGTGASMAQSVLSVRPGAPAAGMGAGTSTAIQTQPGMPAAVPRPGTVTLTMGGIFLNLGSLGAPAQIGPLGATTACPASGIAISPTSAPSTAALQAANGIIPATPAGSTPAFGMVGLSAVCNPITPGSPATATAPPDPNAASDFANGALPLTTLETGSPGMSPAIVVPAPVSLVPGITPPVTSSAVTTATSLDPTSPVVTVPPPAISSSGVTVSSMGASSTIVSMPAPAISSSGCIDPTCGTGP